MKKIISLTNKYIITATPLILFTLFTSIYFALTVNGTNILKLFISLILLVLMTAAFIAGWFSMIKAAVIEPERDEPNEIIKEFIPGIGEYFLTSIGSIFVMFFLNIIILVVSYFAGMHFIGSPEISASAFSNALTNTETLKQFLSGLSSEQLVKISFWNMLLLLSMSVNWFLVMFYLPALFFETKNPFLAYFISLKSLFGKNILKNIGIFIIIISLYFLISVISALFMNNPILNFIITLINFYFICAVALGIFMYYHKSFIESKIGGNVDAYV